MKNAIQIKNNKNILSEIKKGIEKKDNILTTITAIYGQKELIKDCVQYFVGTYRDGKEEIEIERKLQDSDEVISPWMVSAYEFSSSKKTYWVKITMEELI
jgi:hypothetical protein